MSTELVTLSAGGFAWSAWDEIEVTAAISEACRSFTVQTSERPGQFAFPPGTPVQVLATGALLLDGYVNHYHSSGAKTAHTVSISGRSKAQDFVDCSGEHPTSHAKDKTPDQFAQELDHYGIGISAKIPLKKVPMQHLKQGETCFRCVERYTRQQGATMMGRADGGIDITNASVATRAGGELAEGVNILAWSVDFTDSDRHQEYTIKGQGRHGHGESVLRIKERAKDAGVKRRRNRTIVHEGDTDKGRARDRAEHERERCAGNGTKAEVTVQGWRDGGGELWTPNTLIFVRSPILMHLMQDMLIERVQFKQSRDGGTTAALSLVDPRAYRGKGQNGKGTDQTWNEGWDQ